MKKFLFAAIVFVAAVGVFASTLTITDKAGKKMGKATYSFTNASGKLTTKLVMTMEEQGAKVVMDMANVYTAAGDPISARVITTANFQGNSMKTTTSVSFSGRKATVVSNAMGKTSNKSFTSPGNVNDKSMVWFAGKIPAVGTSTVFYSFEPMSLSWSKTTAKYHGTRSVKLSKGTVTAHVMTQTSDIESTKVYFTANGDLLRLESSDIIVSQ